MRQITGISFKKDFPFFGKNRYLCIDLKQHNQLVEDVLDGLEAMYSQGEETVSLNEFNQYIDERLKVNVQGSHQ